MKMTMHIDEDVLDRVMKITGAKTKTQAVEIALTEMGRRHKLKELFNAGLGLTPDQLKAEFACAAADAFDHPASNDATVLTFDAHFNVIAGLRVIDRLS
jgi:Arc/MetJ family transcription regulator